MTGKEVRDIGYLSWKDPYAWMETMRGKRWTQLLAHEKHNFMTLAKQVVPQTRQMKQESTDVYQYLDLPPITIGNGTVRLEFTYSGQLSWSWIWSTKKTICDDLDVLGDHVWYVIEDDEHSYKNKIVCVDAKGRTIWTKKEVSTQVAVIDDLCYYIMVTDFFNTIEVRVCRAVTGGNEHIIYREYDKEKDLQLWKTGNRTLYLQEIDPEKSSLFRIHGDTLIPLHTRSTFQMPVGYAQHDCVFTKQSSASRWKAHGKPISDWILPDEDIQFVTLHSGHVLTIFEGAHTIWRCAPHKKPIRIYRIKAGEITPLYWSNWESINQHVMERYVVKSPFSIPTMIHIVDHVPMNIQYDTVKKPITFKPLEVHRFHTPSKDGTKVPYILIKEKGVTPKALLVYVYGAYGSTSVIDWPYKIWYSLLQRRWAIVYALVRGGGDINSTWANAGRLDNRHHSIDDYEAVIRDSQRVTKISSTHTVLYGRSAGGVPVGAMISRYPDGNLMGAAYTEVPYVDVLRTSSNPSLPLTVGEYKEFGNPRESLVNMKELMNVSPINTLPADGAPGVFVLTRVGLLDRQVYAYESFKWVQRLRGNDTRVSVEPRGKYVMFDKQEAHKYEKEHYIPTHATDMAILDAWVEGRIRV
jgi:hypothetical protein